jgi:hypothetical protein
MRPAILADEQAVAVISVERRDIVFNGLDTCFLELPKGEFVRDGIARVFRAGGRKPSLGEKPRLPAVAVVRLYGHPVPQMREAKG